ncbi:hypothetical protein L1987_73788 [Smallanthus sonchifolius]|uniref:Uncharacterized protein n=1 Tax=Smallanthus sonchifolius TaxID=185202 RepID=A0ACB9A193_9ASTR|nr:hypothetical protein L1987_73788 [Smallanthus sonchifolius]
MGLKGGNKVVSGNPDGRSLSPPPEFNLHHPNYQLFKQTPKMLIIFAMVGLSCLVLYHSSITFPFSGDYNSFAAGTLLPDSASKDLNKVCTMHPNCCVGLENKVHDLGIMLGDWRKYKESFANQMTRGSAGSWKVPQLCRGSLHRPRVAKKKVGQGRKS